MVPNYDPSGFIDNAAMLSASQVALQKVRCPACGQGTFDKWPLGWDGHVGYKCSSGILSGLDIDAKKLLFKVSYARLFKS